MGKILAALGALSSVAIMACGKADPPVGRPIDGRDAGAAGTGADIPDATMPAATDSGVGSCLSAGGGASVTNAAGDRITDAILSSGTAVVVERAGGASSPLVIEFVVGETELDAGTDELGYRFELSMTGLPTDLVRVGDMLDVAYETHDDTFAGPSDTLVLSRGDELVFFATRGWPDRLDQESLVPQLERFGIELSASTEVSCEFAQPAICRYREHALRLVVEGDEAEQSPSGLLRAGDLSVAGRVLELASTDSECNAMPVGLYAAGFQQ